MILFGEDFDGADFAAEPQPTQPDPAADQDAACRAAHAQGVAEGAAFAVSERAALAERWSGLCAERLQEAQMESTILAEQAAVQICGLVLDMVRSLLPALTARHGGAEIAALARTLLPALRTEPRIAIHINPHDRRAIEDVLGAMPAELGGRVTLTPTDRVHAGDLQVAWQDGSLTRDTARMLAKVEAVLGQYGLGAQTDTIAAASLEFA